MARVALGLIALHVVDDNFLQPQPGTSAGDHLVSGLVPLGVLGLAAWGYPRLRAGLRAVLALFFGIFGDRDRHRGRLLHDEGRPDRRRLHRACWRIPAGIVLIGLGVRHALAIAEDRRQPHVAVYPSDTARRRRARCSSTS